MIYFIYLIGVVLGLFILYKVSPVIDTQTSTTAAKLIFIWPVTAPVVIGILAFNKIRNVWRSRHG